MRRNLLLMLAVLLVVVSAISGTTYKFLFGTAKAYEATNGYGGAVADLAADGAWDWGADIPVDPNGYYGLWVTIAYDSSGTTDNIVLGYIGSLDGTNFDDLPMWQIELDRNGGADTQQTIPFFPPPPHGKLGVKTTGTTDTFDYSITYQTVRGDGT